MDGLDYLGILGRADVVARVGTQHRNAPFVEQGQFDAPGEKVEFEKLLSESDYLCVHAPLTSETRGMRGTDAFAQMKSTAVVVNCSRGPIIDTEALINALDSGA